MIEPNVSIFVEERHGVARTGEPIRIGVPFPRGVVSDPNDLELCDAQGLSLPIQTRTLSAWPEQSTKWLLVDALVDCAASTKSQLTLRRRRQDPSPLSSQQLHVSESGPQIVVDTGVARFQHDRAKSVTAHLATCADQIVFVDGALVLRDASGASREVEVERHYVEEAGPIRAHVVALGRIHVPGQTMALRVLARAVYVAGSACVRQEIQILNPQASAHPGGLWDLGDSHSALFSDLSFRARAPSAFQKMQYRASGDRSLADLPIADCTVFQASSGGEQWNSRNHVDREGKLPLEFRGYRITTKTGGEVRQIEAGERAQPMLALRHAQGSIAVAVEHFWQNFPKALRVEGDLLSVGLFPLEQASPFELQGGEQKRHALFLQVGSHEHLPVIDNTQRPLEVSLDPEAVERSCALPAFIAEGKDSNWSYLSYVRNVIEGPHSFYAKREVIDEFGWRNFGELYADHEAVKHAGSQPLVSHYNNQYDFIYGGLIHFLRSSDQRWLVLARDSARHTIDIDLYHTDQDKAAFNGGMFWHTDHYQDAATCTHRTYSRRNAANADYGGGPSNEHNYTSGLLLYYYLTGDMEARAAVLQLADWVLRMDDGALTLLSLISTKPTGAASKTREESFHGPGRGAGNSINALLDAYTLTRSIHYMLKAQELVLRCIHPKDAIDTLRLDDPESRWSYLVFLQVLGKFLDVKSELAERDHAFHYARESLLHYARWIVRHETPYKDVLHKVQIPTETWPAQDIRKCHVLHLAAKYSDRVEAAAFREKAAVYFERCLGDLLSFNTAYVTRPMVLLTVYGHVHAYYASVCPRVESIEPHSYAFGEPVPFLGQRSNLRNDLRARLQLVSSELQRLIRDKLYELRLKFFARSAPKTQRHP